jgi:hypothetical protein
MFNIARIQKPAASETGRGLFASDFFFVSDFLESDHARLAGTRERVGTRAVAQVHARTRPHRDDLRSGSREG